MAFHILVVEDQREIREITVKYLEKEGHVCHQAQDGFSALETFNNTVIHLVVLDVMMPGIDGFEVLVQLRRISEVPVIMLTARQEEIDRLKGFDAGADDYVVKPFSAKELVRRVRRLLQRVYHDIDEIVLKCKEFMLHTGSRKLFRREVEIPITTAEYSLLRVMFRNQGQVLTRDQLIQMAYGDGYDGVDRNIDSHIKRIRQKIEEDSRNPQLLVTKYGAGYVFGGDGR